MHYSLPFLSLANKASYTRGKQLQACTKIACFLKSTFELPLMIIYKT